MKSKMIVAFVVMVVLSLLICIMAEATETAPPVPTGQKPGSSPPSPPTLGDGNAPPSPPNQDGGNAPQGPPSMGEDNGTQPMRERLESFYMAKENYINQKRQCKESAVATNAAQGTCWDMLKPIMQGLLQREVELTEKRLIQLSDKNLTFPNREEIDAELAKAKAIFKDSSSSKYTLKSTANRIEDLINQIEDTATQKQPELLIRQMDNLMVKADELTGKLEAKLSELKASGYNTGDLEYSLDQYKADLERAKENVANAKVKYAQTQSAEDISQMAREVRNFVNDAKNYLEKAFDKAKRMVPGFSGAESSGTGQNQGSGMGQQPMEGAE